MTSPNNVRFELLEGGSYDRYMVKGDREVRFILRQLAARRANLSAYPDASGEFALLALLEVPEQAPHILLDIAADEAVNLTLSKARRIICVTQLDRVKIQFALGPLAPERFHNGPCFQAKIPDSLLRLQRREYFRLVAPVAHPVRCTIPLDAEANAAYYEARVLDISGGGVAVVAPPPNVSFTPGMCFENCTVHLPEALPITATLRICNIFSVTQRNGTELQRAGCEFVGLTAAQESAIQRYILRVERDRATRVTE